MKEPPLQRRPRKISVKQGGLLLRVPEEMGRMPERKKPDKKWINEILNQIPIKNREIVRLHFGIGGLKLTDAEIGEQFGISEHAVRERVKWEVETIRKNRKRRVLTKSQKIKLNAEAFAHARKVVREKRGKSITRIEIMLAISPYYKGHFTPEKIKKTILPPIIRKLALLGQITATENPLVFRVP